MLEPSNPMPSSNKSFVKSSTGIEKCCQTPGRSTNLRSTILTPESLANCRTSAELLDTSTPPYASVEVKYPDRKLLIRNPGAPEARSQHATASAMTRQQ